MNSNNDLAKTELLQKSDSENQSNNNEKAKHDHSRKIDLNNTHDCFVKIFNFIKPNSNVLDIGGTLGILGQYLKSEKNCTVTGVSDSQESVTVAKNFLDNVLCLDINSSEVLESFKGRNYDHIIFADIMERSVDPLSVLTKFKTILSKDGTIIISIPNIAHSSPLMQEALDYSEEGSTDKKHLRFFTTQSILSLIDLAELLPIDIDRAYIDNINSFRTCKINHSLDEKLVEKIESFAEAKTFKFILNLIPCENEFHRKSLRKMIDGMEDKIHCLANEDIGLIKSQVRDLLKVLTNEFSQKIEALEKTCESLTVKINEQSKTQEYMINDLEQIESLDKKFKQQSLALGLMEQRILRYSNILPIRILKIIRRTLLRL